MQSKLLASCLALASLGACERSPAAAAQPSAKGIAQHQSAGEITCISPVKAEDTAASLRQRYGSDARAETLGGAEGSEFDGMALWPDEPARRIEVFFSEDSSAKVSSLRLGERAQWRVAGLALGDPLARLSEVNGRPFTFLGFGWDYGGYVSDWSGGRLAAQPGGCTLSMRLDALAPVDATLPISGDVEVRSDLAGLDAADVRLVELGVGFPAE